MISLTKNSNISFANLIWLQLSFGGYHELPIPWWLSMTCGEQDPLTWNTKVLFMRAHSLKMVHIFELIWALSETYVLFLIFSLKIELEIRKNLFNYFIYGVLILFQVIRQMHYRYLQLPNFVYPCSISKQGVKNNFSCYHDDFALRIVQWNNNFLQSLQGQKIHLHWDLARFFHILPLCFYCKWMRKVIKFFNK